MATGQEANALQIADLLLKYGSLVLNLILGLVIYIYNRELKAHKIVHDNLIEKIERDFEIQEKDVTLIKENIEKNNSEVHESFQVISKNIKEERSFWQDFFNKIKVNIDELYNLSNMNNKNIQSIQTQLESEIKRLDEKIQSLKDLLLYRMNGKDNAGKNN